MTISSYSSLKPELFRKFRNESWSARLFSYLRLRYNQIESRLLETSRYIEIETNNKMTFSFEFGSLLRDLGSAFSSIMDVLVGKTTEKPKKEYCISDYTKFLIKEISNIELIGLRLEIPFKNCHILPFEGIKTKTPPKTKLHWWEPYNNIKHSEINYLSEGCLEHVILGIGTLATLYKLMNPSGFLPSKLFGECGFFEPLDEVKKMLF